MYSKHGLDHIYRPGLILTVIMTLGHFCTHIKIGKTVTKGYFRTTYICNVSNRCVLCPDIIYTVTYFLGLAPNNYADKNGRHFTSLQRFKSVIIRPHRAFMLKQISVDALVTDIVYRDHVCPFHDGEYPWQGKLYITIYVAHTPSYAYDGF